MAIISSGCGKARRRLYLPIEDRRATHSIDDPRSPSSSSDEDDNDNAGNMLANIGSEPGGIKQPQQPKPELVKLLQAEYVAVLGPSIAKINRELAHCSAAQRASHIRRAMDTCMIMMPPASPYPPSSTSPSSSILPQTASYMASHPFAAEVALHLQYHRRQHIHSQGQDHHRHHHHHHPHHRCRYVKILRRHRRPDMTMMTRLRRSCRTSTAATARCRHPNLIHNDNNLASSSTTLMMQQQQQQQQQHGLNCISRSQMRLMVGHSSNYTIPNSDPAVRALTVNHPSRDHQLLQAIAADHGQTIIKSPTSSDAYQYSDARGLHAAIAMASQHCDDAVAMSNVIGSINIDYNNHDILSRNPPPPPPLPPELHHHMGMAPNATGDIDDVDGDHHPNNIIIPTQDELRKLQSALRFPEKYNHVVISNLGRDLDDRLMLGLYRPWRQRSNNSSSAAAASSAGHMPDISDPNPDSASDSDADSDVLDPVMLLGQAAQHILALQFQLNTLNSILSL